MNRELTVLKIMDSEKCCWEDALEKEKEIKSLNVNLYEKDLIRYL